MSDTNSSNTYSGSPKPGLPSGGRRPFHSAKTVTVEVRRKKANVLDRRKALSGGDSAKVATVRRSLGTGSNLTASEMDARMQALRKASQGGPVRTLPPRPERSSPEAEAPLAQTATSFTSPENLSLESPAESDRIETTLREGARSLGDDTPAVRSSELPSRSSAESSPRRKEPGQSFPSERRRTPREISREFSSERKAPSPRERTSPVILRAASYGPSPQQLAREKEAARRKAESPAPRKSEESRSRKPSSFAPRGAEEALFLTGKETHTRPVRERKSFEDLDRGESRGTRKSSTETPRRLTRRVLTRFMDDEEETRFRSEASFKRAQRKRIGGSKTEAAKVIRDVVIPDTITVGELSNRMAVSSALVIKSLMKLGTMATINQAIDGDTAELICMEFGHRPKRTSEDDVEMSIQRAEDRPEDMLPRPPIITVMGHVDHGKTSLLDALRKTDIISTEFGGITQHIGAYQIVTPFSEAKITFLDTPGHAAFSEMRARGADVTDIVVLVVAADDSVNAQTVEAIAHAKAAEATMIVAINKIDKPTADPQKIRNELLNHNVILEDFGGDVLAVEISAKQGTNLDRLVETILLQADMLELRASPQGSAEGTVIEASVEKGRGTVATVLVQKGTLRPGDIFVAGTEFGRVKTMHDFRGQKVTEAGPSCPVGILGFNGIPQAGDSFLVVESEQKAREIAEHRRQIRNEKASVATRQVSAEQLMSQLAHGDDKVFNIVLKADTQGSLEAITTNISKLSVEGIKAKVVHGAIGDINETDTLLAKASNASLIGFNVRATPQAKDLARRENLALSYYTIIYELFENITKMMKGLLAPTFEERSLGRAELRVVFSKGKVTKIAGCYVLSGLIRRSNAQIRVHRGNEVVFTGKIETMKHEKDDIKEAREGHECGIILDGFNDLKVGDILECFEIVEVKPE